MGDRIALLALGRRASWLEEGRKVLLWQMTVGSENWLEFAQFACTVPTQREFAMLSAIKTIRYERFITRSG
jgi:hypothetical protein